MNICYYDNCNEKSFGSKCLYCKKKYCYNHITVIEHKCTMLNNVNKKKSIIKKKMCQVIDCHEESCGKCGKCNKYVCITHRKHTKHSIENSNKNSKRSTNCLDNLCIII